MIAEAPAATMLDSATQAACLNNLTLLHHYTILYITTMILHHIFGDAQRSEASDIFQEVPADFLEDMERMMEDPADWKSLFS